MPDDLQQQERETTTQAGNTTQTTREVSTPGASSQHAQTVASRLIWYVAGVIMVLLGFRFVLTLLGANQANSFAHFIYSASHPFVAPFFTLFGYKLEYGVAHFELYTLVAMAVYALVAWGLARLATIARPE